MYLVLYNVACSMLLLFQDKDKKFLACENVPFKTQFIDMIALMRYNSWRIKDHSRLQTFSLKQLHDICYAIALTRHGEAFFKKIGKLSRESYMSIQDVSNKALDDRLVHRDWTLSELEPLVKILQREDYILDKECPLTYSRERKASESDGDSNDIYTCCQYRHCPFTYSRERKASESDGDSNDSDGTIEYV